MVSYFVNSLSSSVDKGITLLYLCLKFLPYPLILGNRKANGLNFTYLIEKSL